MHMLELNIMSSNVVTDEMFEARKNLYTLIAYLAANSVDASEFVYEFIDKHPMAVFPVPLEEVVHNQENMTFSFGNHLRTVEQIIDTGNNYGVLLTDSTTIIVVQGVANTVIPVLVADFPLYFSEAMGLEILPKDAQEMLENGSFSSDTTQNQEKPTFH